MEGREHSTQSSGPLISPATRQGLAHPSRHDCPNSQQSLLRRCPVGRSQLIIRSTMYLASGSAGSAGVCALIAATLRWWPRLTRNERERPPCFGRNLRTSMIRPKPPRCRATASWWHFRAAQAVSVLAANTGQVWIKSVPDGEPLQLTKTAFRKQTINFSQDGSRVYFGIYRR